MDRTSRNRGKDWSRGGGAVEGEPRSAREATRLAAEHLGTPAASRPPRTLLSLCWLAGEPGRLRPGPAPPDHPEHCDCPSCWGPFFGGRKVDEALRLGTM